MTGTFSCPVLVVVVVVVAGAGDFVAVFFARGFVDGDCVDRRCASVCCDPKDGPKTDVCWRPEKTGCNVDGGTVG